MYFFFTLLLIVPLVSIYFLIINHKWSSLSIMVAYLLIPIFLFIISNKNYHGYIDEIIDGNLINSFIVIFMSNIFSILLFPDDKSSNPEKGLKILSFLHILVLCILITGIDNIRDIIVLRVLFNFIINLFAALGLWLNKKWGYFSSLLFFVLIIIFVTYDLLTINFHEQYVLYEKLPISFLCLCLSIFSVIYLIRRCRKNFGAS